MNKKQFSKAIRELESKLTSSIEKIENKMYDLIGDKSGLSVAKKKFDDNREKLKQECLVLIRNQFGDILCPICKKEELKFDFYRKNDTIEKDDYGNNTLIADTLCLYHTLPGHCFYSHKIMFMRQPGSDIWEIYNCWS